MTPVQPAPSEPFNIWRALMVSLMGYYAQASATLLPALVGQWMTTAGISEGDAGLIATGSLIGQTLGLLVGTVWMRRAPLTVIAMTGLALALPTDAISIFAHSPLSLMAARSVNGVGAGLLLAAALNWLGRHPRPEKYFATLVTLQFLLPVPILFGLPALSRLMGDHVIYLCMVAVGLASLPALRLLAQLPSISAVVTAAAHHTRVGPIKLMAVATSAIFSACVVGAWAFLVPYAARAGIDRVTGMQAIAWSSAFGVVGTTLVSRLRTGSSAFGPLALSLGTLAALFLWFGLSVPSPVSFYCQVILLNLVWAFAAPIIQGVQAALDVRGSVPLWGAIAGSVGAGIGPGAAGQLIVGGNFLAPFGTMAAGMLVAAALILPCAWAVSTRLISPHP